MVLSIMSALRSRSTRSARVSSSPRTRRPRPSVGNGGRRCSTCRIHQADATTAVLCAPSTSCPRNSADYLALADSRVLALKAGAARSPPILHLSVLSVRPKLPPNGSLESKSDSAVNLCPGALAEECVLPQGFGAFQESPSSIERVCSVNHNRTQLNSVCWC